VRCTGGAITGANDAFLQLTGYTREDLDGGLMNWIAMTPPEFAERDRHCLREMAPRGVCMPYEKEFIRKDGTRVPVFIGAANFEDNPEEGVCFVLDLTERKKLEQQFLRAQRMESIGTLAGGIAHDLNNALSPIMMALEVLKIRFPDPESLDVLDLLSISAQRGADMVRQVLSFARGVEGRRMEVQVKHLIRDIEKITSDTFVKTIQVRSKFPGDLWTVMGDPTQLHQVLLNLSVNARDAMPNGGVLTFSAENLTLDAHYASLNPEAKPGPYVFIQVEDTGSGIPPETLEKIFDPFFTTKEVGKGTGLGLSTSLAIVKSHGGFMRVYSEMGKGTKFHINLPAQTEASVAVTAEIAAELPRGNGEVILVVDDEASVRQITQQTLEAFGYRVILASDGSEALAIYATRRAEIAAVLTDMTMPVMDGLATIHVLKKLDPAVRIIAASGRTANSQIAGLGVKHFLTKPYTAETLLKVLKEMLASA
jgi:PAS domain S-box-containing protein